jgi:hypothetical protein
VRDFFVELIGIKTTDVVGLEDRVEVHEAILPGDANDTARKQRARNVRNRCGTTRARAPQRGVQLAFTCARVARHRESDTEEQVRLRDMTNGVLVARAPESTSSRRERRARAPGRQGVLGAHPVEPDLNAPVPRRCERRSLGESPRARRCTAEADRVGREADQRVRSLCIGSSSREGRSIVRTRRAVFPGLTKDRAERERRRSSGALRARLRYER